MVEHQLGIEQAQAEQAQAESDRAVEDLKAALSSSDYTAVAEASRKLARAESRLVVLASKGFFGRRQA